LGLPPPPPAAVVFDNDGLLVDTEGLWTKAEEKLFAAHGRRFAPEHKREMVGVAGPRAEALLERMLDAPGRGGALLSELNALVGAEAELGVAPMPGAADLIDALEAARIPLALVSNSPLDFVELTLERSGFAGRFAVVLTPDHGHPHKPEPALYVEACNALGADPRVCVGLEDTATGVAAVRAAGMGAIGIPFPGVELDAADLVASSLSDERVWRALGLEPKGVRPV
jgi:HAD superfamily hydrolase (TIGR01509 family)